MATDNGPAAPVLARAGQNELHLAAGQLNKAIEDFGAQPAEDGTDADKAQRRNIVEAATRILDAVKNPVDQWMDMSSHIAIFVANRLFWEWGVFEAIPLDGTPISYANLASKAKADTALITRIGGVLVSSRVLRQTGADKVSHTDKSKIFTTSQPTGLVYQMTWENGLVPYAHMPKYFEEYGRKEPQGPTHVPTSYAYGHPELGYYEMLEQDPERMKRFMRAMAPIEERMPIAGIYDFGWVVALVKKEPESTRPLLIDVGGGRGHAIKAIRSEFPDLPIQRFILEDRPQVINAGKALDDPELRGIQRVAIDFHKEQPVKGALIYWVRRCLHNYSDVVCTNILQKIAEAMAPDSKILLQEDVMENPPNPMAALLDMMMMGMGGKQRTIENWSTVIGGAGLEIVGISRGQGPWRSLSVLECIKKQ